ncbi:hypothetical protein FOA52_009641 [Chlamydomonas sp. UWO 241]|nr:hypothetical protein FOA52_009641 [Chlamydomonas sp. UWO 241]
MDEHNVHHFWGISPPVDMGALATRQGSGLGKEEPMRLLQVAPCDARHTLTTVCRASRTADAHTGPLHLTVWEEEPEGLARHLLLVAVMLDSSLPEGDRVQTLLELHGNALLRERTAQYLDGLARAMESMLVGLFSGAEPQEAAGGYPGLAALASCLDLSLLKFAERDAITDVFHGWRKSEAYDMVQAWDARGRKWYGDRYDFRRNMIDWDYHMRMIQAGTPGCDPSLGSIVHFHHFRHWRAHGIAYELRDSAYAQPNRTLLSTAVGRTREFKDRSGKDVGRSVTARGFWSDILNSPYLALGLVCEEKAFFVGSNKQFSRTSVDIAEHNVKALLHELRTGERLESSGLASRAKVARGPTSIEDLAGEAEKHAGGNACDTGVDGADAGPLPMATITEVEEGEGEGAAGAGEEAGTGAGGSAKTPAGGAADGKAKAGAEGGEGGGGSAPGSAGGAAPFLACPSYRGAKAGYVFTTGVQGVGYYLEDAAAAAASGTGDALPTGGGPGTSDGLSMEAAAEKLREAEAAADAAACARLSSRLRLRLATGDLVKAVTGRAKMQGSFDLVTLGTRHMHLAGPDHKLQAVAKPATGVLVVETAHYMVQLKKEQTELFRQKIVEMAGSAGWQPSPDGGLADGLTAAHALFTQQASR